MRVPPKKIAEQPYRAGFRHMVARTYQFSDGRTHTFDINKTGDVVTICGLTERGMILIANQFRAGPERWLVDLPGGMCEPNEMPLQAAERELLEETGYSGSLIHVHTTNFGAYSEGRHYTFISRDLKKTGEPSLDEGEYIHSEEITPRAFLSALQTMNVSTLTIAVGYIALSHLRPDIVTVRF